MRGSTSCEVQFSTSLQCDKNLCVCVYACVCEVYCSNVDVIRWSLDLVEVEKLRTYRQMYSVCIHVFMCVSVYACN